MYYVPVNQGFLLLFSTLSFKKYSSNPFTGLAWGCTDTHPSTSGSLFADTMSLALHPSEPIHEKFPVALFRLTAFIKLTTSWSDPKIITPKIIIFIYFFFNNYCIPNGKWSDEYVHRISIFRLSCSFYHITLYIITRARICMRLHVFRSWAEWEI